MEPNIYEDPGQFRSEPLPPFPSASTMAGTATAQFPTVTVDQAKHSAPTTASDPFSCNFEDTFTEATEPKVPEFIHNCYKLTYSKVLYFFYVFLSVLIGPILVVVFGLILGLTSFTISWVLNPIFRGTGMCFAVWERFIDDLLNCCLAPYYRVMGKCCSRIAIRYQKVPPGEVIHV